MTLIDARQHVTQPNGWTDCDPIGHAIHHTVTMMLSPNATVQDEINQIKAIDDYHVSQDFGGFGYHTITFPSGRSYLTGNWNRARAHVKYRNHELVGSVAAGTFTNDLAPPAIIAGLAECVAEARRVFGRSLPVRGHGTWADPRAPSSCPGRIREQINSIAQPAAQGDDDMTPEQEKSLNTLIAQMEDLWPTAQKTQQLTDTLVAQMKDLWPTVQDLQKAVSLLSADAPKAEVESVIAEIQERLRE